MESLVDWLEELEGCGYISELNKKALSVDRSVLKHSPEEYILARRNPWQCFLSPDEDVRRVENEVKEI